MALNVPGLVSVIVFYIVILVVGIVAGKKTAKSKNRDEIILANRHMGYLVSFFTLTATNIGGGYINGTAESMAFDGMLWTQAPVFYAVSIAIAGLVYAPKMRKGGYVTMFDPFQLKYGRKVGALLFIPQLLSDLFWGASVLAALGNTVAVILDINAELAVVVSAAVAIFYTFLGGLYSVAYTDIIQFFFIFVGLYLVFPFALNHEAVDLSRVSDTWLGTIEPRQVGLWLDVCLLLIMGGLPWQTYYQRVLACRNWRVAQISSLMCAVASAVLSVPPAVVGVIGAATDWNKTDYITPTGESQLPDSMRSATMPLVMQYLVPLPVSIIAIGTVAAAVMSSADSVILSSASVFAKNIYCDIIRPKASGSELVWVLRVAIVVCGCLATVIAVTADTIYGLFVMCSDLMYVILFPQLTLVLWFPRSNAYGCLAGFFLGFLLRILVGEPLLKLPSVLQFPLYDPVQGQLFPVRTFVMLCSVLAIVLVSLLTQLVFSRGWLPPRFDVMHCLRQRTIELHEAEVGEPMMDRPKEAPDSAVWTKNSAEADGVADKVLLARSAEGDRNSY